MPYSIKNYNAAIKEIRSRVTVGIVEARAIWRSLRDQEGKPATGADIKRAAKTTDYTHSLSRAVSTSRRQSAEKAAQAERRAQASQIKTISEWRRYVANLDDADVEDVSYVGSEDPIDTGETE